MVIDRLAPAERLAFVLHDMFDVPLDEIAPMVGPLARRCPAAREPSQFHHQRGAHRQTISPPTNARFWQAYALATMVVMVSHHLNRTEQSNIHYRWDNSLAPALTVRSGDDVVIETRSGEDDQLRPGDTAEALSRVDFKNRLHALSGPIAIEGAQPGDALAVQVLELRTGSFGFTMQRPGVGLLPSFAPYLRFYKLGGEVAAFEPGVEVPIRPFLGVMGVAPAEPGEHSTIPPGDHGGNLDCRDLTAGCTLFLPVLVPGALFSCGDGHAGQGDGEVCVTAIETAMTARLRFELLKNRKLTEPQAETPDAYMTLSAAPTLEEASRKAIEAMLDLAGRLTGLGRADAYALASVGIDLRINQVVNRPMMGVRAVLSKRLLTAGGHRA